MNSSVNQAPNPNKRILTLSLSAVGITVVGLCTAGAFALHEKRTNTDLKGQLDSANRALTQAANAAITPTPQFLTETPIPTATATALPEPTRTPEPTKTPGLPRLDQGEWPTNAEDFLAAVQVPEDQIPQEYKDDPYYRPLQKGMFTLETDKDGNPTGGVQLFFERNSGDGDKFPFTVIRNSSGVMQYGVMHDPKLRQQAGFTADEVAALGIGNNHIGSGIPVTGNAPVAVEGLTFYPKVNNIDGSGNVHFIWTALGENMQTMEQRLARSAQSSINNHVVFVGSQDPTRPLDPFRGIVSLNTPGGVVNFDADDNVISNKNKPHKLGGGAPKKIGSHRDLPKQAQLYQRDPRKGIRRA